MLHRLSLTVREILFFPELKGVKVIAGEKGLNRVVTKVTVMDAPDILNWLHGGELLITSGYVIRENPLKLKQLIQDMNSVNAAAFGIKVHRFLNEIPAEVIQKADELDFPLLHIPVQFTFCDVFNPIISKLFHKEVDNLRYSETIHRSFFDLIAHGGSVEEILSALGYFLQTDIAFHEVSAGITNIFSKDEGFKQNVLNSSLSELLRMFPNEIVASEDKIYGYILLNAEKEKMNFDNYKAAIEDARTALLLAIKKRISSHETEKQYKSVFVHDLLFHNVKYAHEVWNRAKIFGWDFLGFVKVIAFDIDNFNTLLDTKGESKHESLRERIFSIAIAMMESKFPKIPYVTMSDSVVFLLCIGEDKKSFNKEEFSKILSSIQKKITTESGTTVTIGLGSIKESVFQCHESFEEARSAVQFARSISQKDKILFWEDTGIYRVLNPIYDTNPAVAFYQSHLGKLIDYDLKNKSYPLLPTLNCLVKNNWSLNKAALKLHIHYNTMKYRVDKIHELIDLDIDNHEQRVNILFSLIIYYMNNNLSI